MDDLFKRVFERIRDMTDAELLEKLAGVADHPLVKVYQAVSFPWGLLPTLSLDEAFSRQDVEYYLLSQSISYVDILQADELLAANDERFLLAA
ncbi:hypothetical protein [Azonexus sp.]|uniref:hypothetical protein n=1 Tax=Azonexus sp. TaxID=1872668 RepID=UPI0035B01E53